MFPCRQSAGWRVCPLIDTPQTHAPCHVPKACTQRHPRAEALQSCLKVRIVCEIRHAAIFRMQGFQTHVRTVWELCQVRVFSVQFLDMSVRIVCEIRHAGPLA